MTRSPEPSASLPAERSAVNRSLLALAVPIAPFETIAIYSTLVGQPAQGAFMGLLVCAGAVAGIAYALLPGGGRRRPLSRAALLASGLAVPLPLLLASKIAAAKGGLPAAAPVIQTLLLLLFQTGWALTWWLTVDRGLRDKSRYIPAAVGGMLLIFGGPISAGAGLGEAPTPSEPAVEKFVTFPKPEDYAFARETDRAGDAERGSDFAHYHTGELPLLGIVVETRDWMRAERIDGDLRGIFDREAPVEAEHVLLAKPGFAVSGLEVQAGKHVNAIRVQFGPLDGSRISLTNRYWSDWVGGYASVEPTSRIDADDALVLGISGSKGLVLSSLGLLVAR